MSNMTAAEFKRLAREVEKTIAKDAKIIVRVEGVNHFKQSFQDEGFTDQTLEKWPDISEARKQQKRKRNGRLAPVLTDTSDLGNSITGEATPDGVTFSTDVVYAQRHNEGTNGMPERQFMGPSKALENKIISKIEKRLDKLFK